jgi:hypothetical protein
LKALDLTPLDLRRLKLAFNVVSLLGSIGSFVSRFSARKSSSSLVSLEKAPSSISLIMFPVRSILFNAPEKKEDPEKKAPYSDLNTLHCLI